MSERFFSNFIANVNAKAINSLYPLYKKQSIDISTAFALNQLETAKSSFLVCFAS